MRALDGYEEVGARCLLAVKCSEIDFGGEADRLKSMSKGGSQRKRLVPMWNNLNFHIGTFNYI